MCFHHLCYLLQGEKYKENRLGRDRFYHFTGQFQGGGKSLCPDFFFKKIFNALTIKYNLLSVNWKPVQRIQKTGPNSYILRFRFNLACPLHIIFFAQCNRDELYTLCGRSTDANSIRVTGQVIPRESAARDLKGQAIQIPALCQDLLDLNYP